MPELSAVNLIREVKPGATVLLTGDRQGASGSASCSRSSATDAARRSRCRCRTPGSGGWTRRWPSPTRRTRCSGGVSIRWLVGRRARPGQRDDDRRSRRGPANRSSSPPEMLDPAVRRGQRRPRRRAHHRRRPGKTTDVPVDWTVTQATATIARRSCPDETGHLRRSASSRATARQKDLGSATMQVRVVGRRRGVLRRRDARAAAASGSPTTPAAASSRPPPPTRCPRPSATAAAASPSSKSASCGTCRRSSSVLMSLVGAEWGLPAGEGAGVTAIAESGAGLEPCVSRPLRLKACATNQSHCFVSASRYRAVAQQTPPPRHHRRPRRRGARTEIHQVGDGVRRRREEEGTAARRQHHEPVGATGDEGRRSTKPSPTIAARSKPNDNVIVLLIGHGSFDGRSAAFNIMGPICTAPDWSEACSSKFSAAARGVRQHEQRERRVPAADGRAGTRRHHRDQDRRRARWTRSSRSSSSTPSPTMPPDRDRNGHVSVRRSVRIREDQGDAGLPAEGQPPHRARHDGRRRRGPAGGDDVPRHRPRRTSRCNVDTSDPEVTALVEQRGRHRTRHRGAEADESDDGRGEVRRADGKAAHRSRRQDQGAARASEEVIARKSERQVGWRSVRRCGLTTQTRAVRSVGGSAARRTLRPAGGAAQRRVRRPVRVRPDSLRPRLRLRLARHGVDARLPGGRAAFHENRQRGDLPEPAHGRNEYSPARQPRSVQISRSRICANRARGR